MEIITRKITEEEIEVYTNLLMSKIDNWFECDTFGKDIYFGQIHRVFSRKENYYDDDAILIINELKNLYLNNRELLNSRLFEIGLIPDEILLVSDEIKSKSLPIYTGVYQAGRNSVILEAFFNNEKHLLNSQANILHIESEHEIRLGELDGKEILRIRQDDGICEFSGYFFIEDKFQPLEDFTINSFCFPDFSQKCEYDSLLSEIDKADSPKETALRIISDLEQKQFQDLFFISSIYPYLPKYLREDFEIILSIFLINLKIENNEAEFVPNTLQELSQAILQNQKFIRENKYKIIIDIPSVNEATEALSENIKKFLYKNIDLIKEILFFFPDILEYANEEFLTDKKLVLETVKNNVLALKYSSKVLQSDRDIVIEAVKNNVNALQYASAELRNDREIVLTAVSNHGLALEYASDEFKNDKEIVLIAVNNHGLALKYASNKLKDNKEIALAAIRNVSIDILKYVSENLKSDKDIVLEAVRHNGGDELKYASDILKNDREIVELSISNDTHNITYAGENILRDTDYLIEIIKKYPDCFNHIPEEIQNSIEAKMIELGIQNIIVKKNETSKPSLNLNGKGIKHFSEQIDEDLKSSSNSNNDNDEDELPF